MRDAMDGERVLAFRFARSGLVAREARGLAAAARCPASDFSRDAALLALAARAEDVGRDAYEDAVDSGELVVAHIVRGAIHALAPGDLALYGRALVAQDDEELGVQLGRQLQKLAAAKGFAPTAALAEVSAATEEALARGRRLTKAELHEELRARVDAGLMPWCKGCESHHVAPMLWRFATVNAGVRIDAERRYLLGKPGPTPAASEAVRRFLGFYGPSTPAGFAEWAGLAKPHARRLWDQVERELTAVDLGGREAWILAADRADLDSSPAARGVRLLPPGDPYLQKPNRPLLAPDDELRKRLFRPVASPGAVLLDGRLAGTWKARAKGRKTELAIEKLGRLARRDVEEEAERLADLRGARDLDLVVA